MKLSLKKLMIYAASMALATVVLVGCSSNTSNTPSTATPTISQEAEENSDTPKAEVTPDASTTYPLTVSNYKVTDGTWTSKDQTFHQTPQRVVANTQTTAELLIHLGLTERIVGVAAIFSESAEDIAADFAKIPVLSNDYVGKEPVLGANPDLVIGRWDLFADESWGVGTVDSLNELGMNTYILNACRLGATLDDLYKDIKELGEVFHVQENATTFSESLKAREEQLRTKLSGIKENLTYGYVFNVADGALSIYSGSTDTYQNDALSLIKLDNAFGDATGEVNLEQLIETNPDVLLVAYYNGGANPEETIQEIYNIPSIQSLSAIQNKRVFAIDYNHFWSYGYQIFDGVEHLASDLYPDLILSK